MSTKFTFEGMIVCQTIIEAENYDEARAKYDQLSNADVIEGNDEREVVDWWTPADIERRKLTLGKSPEQIKATINAVLDFYSPDGPGQPN
jgi:hypothetical protein